MTVDTKKLMAGMTLNKRKTDSSASSSLFHSKTIRLLLVDDDSTDRRLEALAVEQIRNPKIELLEAADIDSALLILDQRPIDICLADFRLTGGKTALDLFISARNHGHLMPFIAITGVMDEETTANTLLIAGFDDVLLKSDLQVANIYRIVRNAWLRNAHTRELIEHSTVDQLTSILNRRGLLIRLKLEHARALRSHLPMAILFIDFNGFKKINDEMGHAVGDQALIYFAQILASLLRKSDVAGRMGGDEFIVAMPGASGAIAEKTVGRIEAALRDSPLIVGDLKVSLKISAGLAVSDPESGAWTLDQLLQQADEQMYKNKQRHIKFRWRTKLAQSFK